MSKLYVNEITRENFEYDETMFEERKMDFYKLHYLHYIGGTGQKIVLPEGCMSCYGMFEECDLSGCDFSDFDTSKVTDMFCMFYEAKLPDNLGDKFDTGKVTNMRGMFYNATFPDNFILGDKFTIKDDCDTKNMFKDSNKNPGNFFKEESEEELEH